MFNKIIFTSLLFFLFSCESANDANNQDAESIAKKEGSAIFSQIVNEAVYNTTSSIQTTLLASSDLRNPTYTSSNHSVATINENGLISIHDIGLSTISVVKLEDTEYKTAQSHFELSVLPPSIQNISISGQNESATVAWDIGTSGSLYNLYLAKESFSNLDSLTNYNSLNEAQLFTQIPLNTLSKTITNLDNNIPYYFIITAVKNGIESYPSIEIIHTPSAFNPTTFTSIATDIAIANPNLLDSYIDPNFNTKVIRLTDRINQNEPLTDINGNRITRGNAHPYPKTQAWNSDGSLLRMNYRVYNTATLEELSNTSGITNLTDLYNINGALSEIKWSNVDPNVFYGIFGSQFWKATIDRNNNTYSYSLVHNFNNDVYDDFTLSRFEGNIDFNDEFVVFAARKQGQKYLTAIVYNMITDQVTKKELSHISWPDSGQVFDWLSISPHAGHVLISTNDSIKQYDLSLNKVRDLASSGGHGDLGIDQLGNEVYVQYEYGVDTGIWMYQLSDGSRVRLLPDKYNGGHISCRNHQRLGWCYASTSEEGYKEVIAIKLDPSGPSDHEINRFVQTHIGTKFSLGGVSPNGKSIIFNSSWGDDSIDYVDLDTYIVQLK